MYGSESENVCVTKKKYNNMLKARRNRYLKQKLKSQSCFW